MAAAEGPAADSVGLLLPGAVQPLMRVRVPVVSLLLFLLLTGPAAAVVLIEDPAVRQVVGAEDGWLLWLEAEDGETALRLRHVDALGTAHAAEALAGDDVILRAAMGAGHVGVVVADAGSSGSQRPKDLWIIPVEGGLPLRVVEGAPFLDGPRGDEEALVWSTLSGNESRIHRLSPSGGVATFDVSDHACLLPRPWPAASLVVWDEPPVAGCERRGFLAFDVADPDAVAAVAVEAIALNTGGGYLSFVGFDLNPDGWYLFGPDNLTGSPWRAVPASIRPLWGQADDGRLVWLENPEEHPPQDRPYLLAGVGQRLLPGGSPGFLERQLEYRTLPVLDGARLYYNGAGGALEAFDLDAEGDDGDGGGRGLPTPGPALLLAMLAALALTGRRGRSASPRS